MWKWFVGLCVFAIAGCGGDESGDGPNPEVAAEADLPEFNADAKYSGKTALEYAAGLNDLNPRIQIQALQALSRFKVDALPARDAVKKLLASDASDQVKLGCLAVLTDMKAPEANALFRQKLADPKFFKGRGAYATLLTGSKKAGIDPATLKADLMKLADSDPDHAMTLLATRRAPGEAEQALAQKIFEAEHGEAATAYFLSRLAQLQFLDDAARIAYMRKVNHIVTRNPRNAQQTLLQMGSEEAMDYSLQLQTGNAAQRYAIMLQFATRKVDPLKVLALLMADAKAAKTSAAINTPCTHIDSLVRGMVMRKNPQADAAQTKVAEFYVALVVEGPLDEHRGLGITRVINLVQTKPKMPMSTLDPIYAICVDPAAKPALRIAVAKTLGARAQHFAQRDADYIIKNSVAAMYAGKTAAETVNWERALTQIGYRPNLAPVLVEAIVTGADSHMDAWSMNAAGAVLMTIGGQPGLHRTPARENASVVVGKILVHPNADAKHLQRSMARGFGQLALLDYNTVAGTIGMLEPTIFAKGNTVGGNYDTRQLAGALRRAPAWLKADPKELKKWKAFLQRVATDADKQYAVHAQWALKYLG